jgi:hypothetical protein
LPADSPLSCFSLCTLLFPLIQAHTPYWFLHFFLLPYPSYPWPPQSIGIHQLGLCLKSSCLKRKMSREKRKSLIYSKCLFSQGGVVDTSIAKKETKTILMVLSASTLVPTLSCFMMGFPSLWSNIQGFCFCHFKVPQALQVFNKLIFSAIYRGCWIGLCLGVQKKCYGQSICWI